MLLFGVISYAVVILIVAWVAQRRVKDEEDFIVAGRRMGTWMASATLLATWFGAGTLLTSTDEMATEGFRVVALEPLGSGLCLMVTGLFFARPLWDMKVCTLADYFKLRFGAKAEILQVLTSLPTFIGWIAVQLVALAGLFEVLFGWPATPTIIGLGLFALVYTLLGGMWSVGLTDSLQALLLILGLLLLGWHVWQDLASTTGGWSGAWSQISPSRRTWIPTERMTEFVQWLGWLNIAMLGNIPSQDLMQRVFASRSGSIARKACFIAGGAYILLGCVPILVGLSFPILFPNQEIQSVVIQMAQHYLSGGWMVLFLLAVLSMVLSSMDSGILAPATALGRNLLRPHVTPALSTLALCRWSVVLVSIACVMVALLGSRAFELLESCYSIGLAGLLVPLCFGLFTSMGNQTSALLSMSVGIAVWLIEIGFDLEWPVAPLGAVAGCVVYYIHAKLVATSASWMSK